MENQIEELSKACAMAEKEGLNLLKSERGHKAYTRTSASGSVSNVAEKGSPQQKLDAIKTHESGTTFDMRLAYHGKENGVSREEINRAMSGQHASEVATSKESHKRAADFHADAAKKASDAVYKLHHEQSADWHREMAL